MTTPDTPEPTSENPQVSEAHPTRARYSKSIAPVGSNALANPVPVTGPASGRHRGAPAGGDAAEGGLHPVVEETPHTCHTANCTHAVPDIAHVQQRERQYAERKRLRQPSCRMNDDEYQVLIQAAAACRMSVATFLARAAMNAARDLERTAAEIASEREIVAELFALRRHLGYLGNNLNQIAKVLNSGADAPQALTVLDAVQRAASRVETATGRLLAVNG